VGVGVMGLIKADDPSLWQHEC